MMWFNHPIYPITNRELSGLSHTEQVRSLVGSGVTLIQLREKTADSADFFKDAANALLIARSAGIKLIINDRVDIALALGADGVHLGQDDLPAEAARRLLGSEAIIGFSTHTLEQASAASHLPVDYIAIGPVFSTSTKIDPEEITGVETIAKIQRLRLGYPLVAIGGIDQDNISEVAENGADAAAIVSAIWASSVTPERKIVQMKDIWLINNVV
jgi:thiamine-phosphate pyrophosphorylase